MMNIKKQISCFSIVVTIILFATPAFAGNGILIKPGELSEIIGKPGIVIVDARGEKSYSKRHLPGAVNLPSDLIVSLRDEATIKKSGVALPIEKAEKIFGERGIGNDSRIIVYDRPPNVAAAYVWMTLKIYGAENVRILSGGIKAWKKEKLPLTKEATKVSPAVFKANLRTDIITTADWIIKNKKNIQLLDARSLEEFVGARGVGHIPGGILLEWKQLASAKESFKSAGEINELLSKAGVSKDKEIVVYCEIGPKAAFLYSALNMLGYKPQLYWGSMKDWQDDPNRPVAKK
jgi:thiosulfate/3-mercaptopyruvate sulfurtransferase